MKRTVWGLLCGGVALGMGVYACFVQAENYEEGARLQTLQVELEWYERRISGLRSEVSRFEFMGETKAFDAPATVLREPETVEDELPVTQRGAPEGSEGVQ